MDKEYPCIIPPKGDPGVGKAVMEIVHKCIKDKQDRGLFEDWVRNYEMGRNKHFEMDEDEDIPLTSCNLLHRNRQKSVNILCANKPTFNATPVGRVDEIQQEKSKLMEKSALNWWREQGVQATLRDEIIWNMETYGPTFAKMYYDPDAESGVGETILDPIDPFFLCVYPTDSSSIQKCEAVIQLKPMLVTKAKGEYPESAKDIKPDSSVIAQLNDKRGEALVSPSVIDYTQEVDGTSLDALGMGGGTKHFSIDEDKTLLCECWVKDYSGGYIGNTRRIVVCSAGAAVCEDENNPSINPALLEILGDKMRILYLYDKFPFLNAKSLPDPTTIWAQSDFEHLSPMNENLDKALTYYNMILEYCANLYLLNPEDSGVGNDEFVDGLCILQPHTAASAQGIRYVDPPPMPPQVPQAIELFINLFWTIAGTHDVEQARSAGNQVIAYKALAELQEQQNLQFVGKQAAVDAIVQEIGRMFVSLEQSFRTDDRLFSYKEDGNAVDASYAGQDFLFPVRMGVVAGSTLPVSKVAKEARAIDLKKEGIVDVEYVINELELDGGKELLERLKSGPLGEFMKKLAAMLPVDPQSLQAIAELMQMDMKDFQKAAQKGEIPQIKIPREGQNAEQETAQKLARDKASIENAKGIAEVEKIKQEIQKLLAETRLALAKAGAEEIESGVRIEGSKRDKEKMELDRAKFLTDVERKKTEEGFSDLNNAGYRESGMESNNLQ